MAKTRILWGRIVLFFLMVGSGVGYFTYPQWQDKLEGTRLEQLPRQLAHVAQAGWGKLRSWLPFLRGESSEVAAFLPADTVAFATTQRLDTLATDLEPFLSALEGKDADATARKSTLQQRSRERFGLDLTDPKSLESAGIDFSRGWSAAVLPIDAVPSSTQAVAGSGMNAGLNLDGNGAVVFFLPVKDEDQALAAVRQELEKNGNTVTTRDEAGFTFYTVSPGLSYSIVHESVAFIGIPSNISPIQVLEKLSAEGEHLAEDKGFRRHLQAYQGEWQIFVYANLNERLRKELAQKDPTTASSLQALSGFSATLYVTDQQIRLRSATQVQGAEGGAFLLESPPDGFGEKIQGEAVAVMHSAFDLKAMIAFLEANPESRAKLEEARKAVRQELGVDLDQALLKNLDGRLGAVVLRSEPQAQPSQGTFGNLLMSMTTPLRQAAGLEWPVGGVLWMGLERPEELRPALDAMAMKMREEGKQVRIEQDSKGDWYVWEEVGSAGAAGIVEGHLVVTVGPGFAARVREGLGAGGPGFQASLPKTALEGLERNRGGFFYLDVPRLVSAAEVHPAVKATFLTPQGVAGRRVLDASVRGISSRRFRQDELWMGELIVHGPENGFVASAASLGDALRVLEQ